MNHFLKSYSLRLMDFFPESVRAHCWNRHFYQKLSRIVPENEPELAPLSLLTKPGDTVFDLGANFGLFTRFLSEAVGATGRVFSFEPTRMMFDVLEYNCEHFGLKNSRIFRTALSDEKGTSRMRIPVRRDGSLNLYEASLESASTGGQHEEETIEVETRTLDDFCEEQGIDRVDFIKCDVEGHEIAVLEGARKTLLHHRPSMLIEVNDCLETSPHGQQVLEKVRELRYEVFTVQNHELVPWTGGKTGVDYVLKPIK